MLFRVVLAIVGALALSACNPFAVMGDSEAHIETFHQSWNENDLDAIWKTTAPDLRKVVGRKRFDTMLGDFREIFGEMKSTEREGFNVITKDGVTSANIVMVTQFANGEAVETFDYVSVGNEMRLIQYVVRSPLLDDYDWSKLQGEGFISVPAKQTLPARRIVD